MEEKEEKYVPPVAAITPDEMRKLKLYFGGTWCDCIDEVIDELTPDRLAVYCDNKYKLFRPPDEDEIGIRYSFLLNVIRETRRIGNEEITRERNIIVDFGTFKYRPVETLQSVLYAIQKLCEYEDRTCHKIAREVKECNPANAPKIKQNNAKEVLHLRSNQRMMQTSQGIKPI